MPTPPVNRAEIEPLSGVTAQQALRLAESFHAVGYSDRSVADTFGALEMRGRGGRNLPRLLYLTGEPSRLNTLIRLFLLGVSVKLSDAQEALRPLSVEAWVDAGLVEVSGEEARGLLRVFPFDGLLFAMDPPELLEQGTGPDFVSGLTNSSAALMCCTIRRQSRATLDLGTGCGVLGFLAARHSQRVWATDVNPRALAMARLNAHLNGLSSIEFALGSGFEPVADLKFDLIVTNPPFILGPLQRYTFRDSGMELDGLCRKLVSEAPQHLEEGGFFQCELEWPVQHGEDWKERLAGWLRNTGCDALVLRTAETTWLEQAEETAVDTDCERSRGAGAAVTANVPNTSGSAASNPSGRASSRCGGARRGHPIGSSLKRHRRRRCSLSAIPFFRFSRRTTPWTSSPRKACWRLASGWRRGSLSRRGGNGTERVGRPCTSACGKPTGCVCKPGWTPRWRDWCSVVTAARRCTRF